MSYDDVIYSGHLLAVAWTWCVLVFLLVREGRRKARLRFIRRARRSIIVKWEQQRARERYEREWRRFVAGERRDPPHPPNAQWRIPDPYGDD